MVLQTTLITGLVLTLPLAVVVLLKGRLDRVAGMFVVVLLVVGAVHCRVRAP